MPSGDYSIDLAAAPRPFAPPPWPSAPPPWAGQPTGRDPDACGRCRSGRKVDRAADYWCYLCEDRCNRLCGPCREDEDLQRELFVKLHGGWSAASRGVLHRRLEDLGVTGSCWYRPSGGEGSPPPSSWSDRSRFVRGFIGATVGRLSDEWRDEVAGRGTRSLCSGCMFASIGERVAISSVDRARVAERNAGRSGRSGEYVDDFDTGDDLPW